jgi:hypothetical protein
MRNVNKDGELCMCCSWNDCFVKITRCDAGIHIKADGIYLRPGAGIETMIEYLQKILELEGKKWPIEWSDAAIVIQDEMYKGKSEEK